MFSRIKKFLSEYKEIKYLAYHDALTNLLNRNWLYKNMNNISYKYVYFIDINGLKSVNESGHSYGDSYIKYVVGYIQGNISDLDILVRYAGDEFLLFSDMKDVLYTNDLIAVGYSEIYDNDVDNAIHSADTRMIESKNKLKIK